MIIIKGKYAHWKKNSNNRGGNKDISKNIPFPQALCAYKLLSLVKVFASRLLLCLSKSTESTEFSVSGSDTIAFISGNVSRKD